MKQSVGTVKSFKYVDMVCDQGSINIQYTHKMDTFLKSNLKHIIILLFKV